MGQETTRATKNNMSRESCPVRTNLFSSIARTSATTNKPAKYSISCEEINGMTQLTSRPPTNPPNDSIK